MTVFFISLRGENSHDRFVVDRNQKQSSRVIYWLFVGINVIVLPWLQETIYHYWMNNCTRLKALVLLFFSIKLRAFDFIFSLNSIFKFYTRQSINSITLITDWHNEDRRFQLITIEQFYEELKLQIFYLCTMDFRMQSMN